jgi:antitoxin component YwqK of YwqJK toxin-antitoxin module
MEIDIIKMMPWGFPFVFLLTLSGIECTPLLEVYKANDGGYIIVKFHSEKILFDKGRIRSEIISVSKDKKLHREDGPAYIRYYENGNISYKSYFLNDKYHREDGPAYISYNEWGDLEEKKYYINGELHREDGPAEIYYDYDGNIKYESYWLNGKRHREDGPAIKDVKREYYHDGDKICEYSYEEYWVSGVKYNDNGSAIQGKTYFSFPNGNLLNEEYFTNGKLHREDGPASISYYNNGNIKSEAYYTNGKLHREDDPAIIGYDKDGNLTCKIYMNQGVFIKCINDGIHIEKNEECNCQNKSYTDIRTCMTIWKNEYNRFKYDVN